MKKTVCKYCKKPIRFIHAEGKKAIPVNPKPVAFWPRGDAHGIVVNGSGSVICCDFDGERSLARYGFIPHWLNCARKKTSRKVKNK